MLIFVCVKHVPDTAATIQLTGETEYDEGVKFVMNPYDEFAVEEALQLRDRLSDGSEVVLVTYGKQGAVATLRAGLAMGADRAIHVVCGEQLADSAKTAHVLAAAIRRDGEPGLVFAGMHAVDTEGMQTPYRLAALLDLPVTTNVVAFAYDDGLVRVEREAEGGAKERIEMRAPCVVAACIGLNQPRYPKMPDIIKAKKKPIETMEQAALGVEPSPSATRLVRMELPPEKPPAKILEGAPREAARELVRLLREEAKVI